MLPVLPKGISSALSCRSKSHQWSLALWPLCVEHRPGHLKSLVKTWETHGNSIPKMWSNVGNPWKSLQNWGLPDHGWLGKPKETWAEMGKGLNQKGSSSLPDLISGSGGKPREPSQETYFCTSHLKVVELKLGSLATWSVVYLPLWKKWVRQLGLLLPSEWIVKHVPNHQPVCLYVWVYMHMHMYMYM